MTIEQEVFLRVGKHQYRMTKYTTGNKESFFLGGKSLEFLVQDNKELVKESFEVKVNKSDSGSSYIVKVKSNKTGEFKEDVAWIFPKLTAKRLRKEIIKERKNKDYKKQYTI